MPPDYIIDRGARRVLSDVRGVYSYQVALERMGRLQADPDFDASFSLLMDFREATAVELSHDEIVELTSIRVFSEDSKRAYVVATTEHFGLARMFGSYRAPGKRDIYRVFTDMDEAVAWLGAAPPGPVGP
jgi:hypothetical protein